MASLIGDVMVRRARAGGNLELVPRLRGPGGHGAEFIIREATSTEQRGQARRLIETMYGRQGYHTDAAAELPQHSHRKTLQAESGSRLLGTITLGLDSASGLLVDAQYQSEIDAFRRRARCPSEVTSLAIDPQHGSELLLASLFHAAYVHLHHVHGADDVFIEVNPRHAGFYKRMLDFRQIGVPHLCPRVGAMAVLLHLDLAHAGEEFARYAGSHGIRVSHRRLTPEAVNHTGEHGRD
jgi:hypothetical protein